MKILIYITPLFLLFGCSTPPIIYQKPLQAPLEIMKDCEDFILPKNGTLTEFANVLIDNKKIYELCKNQNKAKKEFILVQ